MSVDVLHVVAVVALVVGMMAAGSLIVLALSPVPAVRHGA